MPLHHREAPIIPWPLYNNTMLKWALQSVTHRDEGLICICPIYRHHRAKLMSKLNSACYKTRENTFTRLSP